jgi:hypothetical protein
MYQWRRKWLLQADIEGVGQMIISVEHSAISTSSVTDALGEWLEVWRH